MGKSNQIDTFCRFAQVSRETITSLIKYENYLIESNKSLNLVGKSTINNIWIRHFLDSSQLIDFIDKNTENVVDLGSGAGFPGLIIAILAKDRKIPIKVSLIEKSKKKVLFLKSVINILNLDVEVSNLNIFELKNKIQTDLVIARAFKPLEIILQLLDQKTVNWKKIFLFLGKSGKNELLQASKRWDIQYKQRMSITSSDSIIIEISNFKKK